MMRTSYTRKTTSFDEVALGDEDEADEPEAAGRAEVAAGTGRRGLTSATP